MDDSGCFWILVLLGGLLALTLIFDNSDSTSKLKTEKVEAVTVPILSMQKDKNSRFEIIVDDETGCQYIKYQGSGITPRLNIEGRSFCKNEDKF